MTQAGDLDGVPFGTPPLFGRYLSLLESHSRFGAWSQSLAAPGLQFVALLFATQCPPPGMPFPTSPAAESPLNVSPVHPVHTLLCGPTALCAEFSPGARPWDGD